MTSVLNFEGVANGNAFSNSTIIAGSDITSANIFLNNGTAVSNTANAFYGTACAEFNAALNLTIVRFLLPGTGLSEVSESFLWQCPDHIGNAQMTINSFRTGDLTTGTPIIRVKYFTSGLVIAGTTGGDFTIATAAQLTPGTWYRVEIYALIGGTASTGTVRAKIYPAASSTIVAGSTAVNMAGTANIGIAPFTVIEIGVGSILTANMTMRYDLLRIGAQSTEFGPPTGNTAPVANAGAAKTVTLGNTVTFTPTDSDADGTIASRQWTYMGALPATAVAPTIVGSTATTAGLQVTAVTGSDGARHQYKYVVTDNNGASSPDSFVYLYIPSTTAKGIEVVGSTEYTTIGGGSLVANVSDSSDATGVTYPVGSTTTKTIKYRLSPLKTLNSLSLPWRRALSAAGAGTCAVRLYEGVNVRYSWTSTPTTTITSETLTHLNGTGDISTITDWTQLDVEFSWGP
jgi:hypothetical protein